MRHFKYVQLQLDKLISGFACRKTLIYRSAWPFTACACAITVASVASASGIRHEGLM